MKRNFLDITKKLFRQNKRVLLEKQNDTDTTYWIYKLIGYRFSDVLREIENVDFKKGVTISINTQRIKNTDYIIQTTEGGIEIKFLKSSIGYELTETDRVEMSAQLEKYA